MRNIAISLAVCGICAFAGAFPLVKARQPQVPVVIRANADAGEVFAAEEFIALVAQISGATLALVRDDALPDTGAVVVGAHPANADLAAELERRTQGHFDRFAWRGDDKFLRFSAPTADALAWAVWDYLESRHDVGFLMPGPYGTYLPEQEDMEVAPGEVFARPALDFRAYSLIGYEDHPTMAGVELYQEREHGLKPSEIFSARMRLNMWRTLAEEDLYAWLGSGHSYQTYLPIERYGSEHPEWYALQNGVRRTDSRGGYWQLCLSNAESAPVFAANAIADIEEQLAKGVAEERIILCVVPNDMGGWCECAACADWRDPDGSFSSAVLHYTNQVADAVAAVYPRVKVLHFVYDAYGTIPTRTTPRPNVYSCVTAWSDNNSLAVNQTAGMIDPKKNATAAKVFQYWVEHSAGIMSYTYYGHYEHFTPWPFFSQIAEDMKRMSQYPNYFGSYSESALHWGTQSPNFYLHSKLMWNPQADPAAILAEYFRKAHGAAAPEVAQYYAILQRHMDQLATISGTGAEIPYIVNRRIMPGIDALMAVVRDKLPTLDAAARYRTQLVISGWENSKKYAEALYLLHYGTGNADLELARNYVRELNEFLAGDTGRVVFFPGVTAQALKNFERIMAVDLQALDAGETSREGHVMFGGTVKFQAQMKNLTPEIWGFYLPRGGSGELILPLKARPGVAIKQLRAAFTGPENVKMRLFVLAPDGREVLLADTLSSEYVVAEEYLNRNAVTLVLKLDAPPEAATYAITQINLNIQAEKVL